MHNECPHTLPPELDFGGSASKGLNKDESRFMPPLWIAGRPDD